MNSTIDSFPLSLSKLVYLIYERYHKRDLQHYIYLDSIIDKNIQQLIWFANTHDVKKFTVRFAPCWIRQLIYMTMADLADYWASQPAVVWIIFSVCIQLIIAILVSFGYLIYLLRWFNILLQQQ